MKYENLLELGTTLHHLSKLNVYVISPEQELSYKHEVVNIPSFMPGAEHEDPFRFSRKMSGDGSLYAFTNEWKLNYLGYVLESEGEEYRVILGPYFDELPNLYRLSADYRLNSKQSEELRLSSSTLRVLTIDEVRSYRRALLQSPAFLVPEAVGIVKTADESEKGRDKKPATQPMEKEEEIVHLRYQVEKDFMFAVEKGDEKEALSFINSESMLFSFAERFPHQPMARSRNLAIVLNTLLRIAVERSGVPPILIHRLSERNATTVITTESLADIYSHYDRMIAEYCELVRKYSLSGYSTLTKRAMEYLINFYDRPVENKEIADICFTHPGHLARTFKRETGWRLTDYQRKLRLDKAKHLLETQALPVEKIAFLVGYEDASYFGRLFKKETGVTPLQYRENKGEKTSPAQN